ncbi:uncharacterized protein BO80DRAFT_355443 [Aspergillus ibericus CBS 121593]|uniref:PhoD-like phosphatase domain-containing protein n=1 Tax=Aspergillus ibericus CBS 121593 TaxID=1448316 RepID=A0A395H0H2_9EURO|nr:hypothetical protein BO80DRAFT_355443 [Aspergillus ibericus CBS 121593]RAL01093.1 hypothetical protein BO80DRAFT_355443 [Aspergillus ibericus CBS 121593]
MASDLTNGAQTAPSHRRQPSHVVKSVAPDYYEDNDFYTNPTNSRPPPAPYTANSGRVHSHHRSRSYSARSKSYRRDVYPEDSMEWKENPPASDYPAGPDKSAKSSTRGEKHGDDALKASASSNSQPSPISRSNTVRSTTEQRRDWAADRSPLQKLEVTYTGASKEEKRARALEAEMKLRERMKREAESRATAPAHPSDMPEHADQRVLPGRTAAPSQPAPGAKRSHHRQAASEGQAGYSPPGQNPSERARPPRSKAPPPQSAADRPFEESPYDDGLPDVSVKRGSAPRRTVSVNHPPQGPPMGPRAMNQGKQRDAQPYPAAAAAAAAAVQDPAVPEQPRMAVPSRKAVPNQPNSRALPYPDLTHPNTSPPQLAPERGSVQQGIMKSPTGAAPGFPGPANTSIERGMGEFNPTAPPGAGVETSAPSKPKVSFNVPPPTPPPLFEWRTASVARLGASDFDFQRFDADRSKTWWETGDSNNRRTSRALPNSFVQKLSAQKPTGKPSKRHGPSRENPVTDQMMYAGNKRFQPSIFLQSGPLLRYAGLKRVRIDGPNGPFNKETWRGSVLIVTQDSLSCYEPRPTLRLFAQPMDLLAPPPVQVDGEDAQLAPEYIDPAAGLMKLGRDGRPLYVKPVEHTVEGEDLSFVENDDGIYEMSPSIMDYSSEGVKQPVPANRIHPVDGEGAGSYKEIAGARLYADPGRDVTFWKFNLEIELGPTQQRVAYRLNQGPALGFWVPARGQSMNVMFHTGNGFSPAVDSNKLSGPDPLWRDVLNEHQTRPFHVMIGGGDQIFNDKVIAETAHFQEWVRIKNLSEKYDSPFSAEFKAELEDFYLANYSAWFSQGLFSLANSQIPMVNMWNDHEIIEGFGSYPEEFMNSPVISGLGSIAFKYYLLFQHHSVPEETEAEEPSWILGAKPGPYINQRSRHVFMSLGDGVAFLGLDCRTERMTDEIICEETGELIWDRCHQEIVRGETRHLIVSLGIPLAYPRVAVVKNILNSRKSLGKAGLFGGLVNKTGAKVEIFDDHWTAKRHKAERTYLIEDLQDLAAEKSVRVTILSGDVHLAAIGQFYSNPKLNVPKDRDYRYMPNIISSAIADQPETEMISDTLNKRNHVHHIDTNTDEDMLPIFTHDVNNKPRNNKRLLPRRNWCSIREYQPGSTPPATPQIGPAEEDPRPAKLKRTLSLTRGDKAPRAGLLRRLSLRGPPPTKDFHLGEAPPARRMSMDGAFPGGTGDAAFPPAGDAQPGPFLRRSTTLTRKASKRGGAGPGALINLEGGLAITLNLELNPKDPAGITTPYKFLVPALHYEDMEFDPPAASVAKGWRKWLGVRSKKRDQTAGAGEETDAENGLTDEEYDDEFDDEDGDEPEPYAVGDGGVLPETLVPVSPADGEGEGEEEEVKEVPKRKKWFGRSK